MFFVVLAMFVLSVALFIFDITALVGADEAMRPEPAFGMPLMIFMIILFVAACFLLNGFFLLQSGQARVCVLFGKYVGTVNDEGLRWANPLYAKNLGLVEAGLDSEKPEHVGVASKSVRGSVISMRLRTLNGERLKVNDKMGNPIEIATVVSWHIADTAKTIFDVDDYESYVSMQTETALRHVASVYAYDHMEDEDESTSSITLRSNIEEVSDALKAELDRRFAPAGVAVEDARLTHLVYAPEIAQVMLRRQQPMLSLQHARRSSKALSPWWRWRPIVLPKAVPSSSTTSARQLWHRTSWSCSVASPMHS